MRTLEPPNRLRLGLMGIVVTILVIGVGQSFTSVPVLFAKPAYYGQFTDTGGISTGDKVRIAGMDVGKVEGLKIDGDHVLMKFSIGTNTIGTESRLAIRTDTILGKKVMEIEARGPNRCGPGPPCRSARARRRIRSMTPSSTSPRPRPAGTSTPSKSRCTCSRRPSTRPTRT